MKKYLYSILCIAVIIGIVINLGDAVASVNSNALELKQKTIVIDAGHGGEDGGAIGQLDVNEKDINLKISIILKDLFELGGYKVIMTRDGDYSIEDTGLGTIAARKSSDIKNRVKICSQNGIDAVLSIHQNHFQDSKYSGAQMFYGINTDSELLAESIQKNIVENIQPENQRKIKKAEKSIYLLNHVGVPAVIVECGFISNMDETIKLMDEEYQHKMAYAIYMGADEYFRQ